MFIYCLAPISTNFAQFGANLSHDYYYYYNKLHCNFIVIKISVMSPSSSKCIQHTKRYLAPGTTTVAALLNFPVGCVAVTYDCLH